MALGNVFGGGGGARPMTAPPSGPAKGAPQMGGAAPPMGMAAPSTPPPGGVPPALMSRPGMVAPQMANPSANLNPNIFRRNGMNINGKNPKFVYGGNAADAKTYGQTIYGQPAGMPTTETGGNSPNGYTPPNNGGTGGSR